MISSVPALDIYFIDYNFENVNSLEWKKIITPLLTNTIKNVHPSLRLLLTLNLPIDIAFIEELLKLKRLIEENRFNIINSPEELKQYTNATGNTWVVCDKKFRRRQYYIRHPKKQSSNILIEANAFYDYIEKEQKDELIDFIFSHCPAKKIRIDRISEVEGNAKVSGKIKGYDPTADVQFNQLKGNYFQYNNPNGIQAPEQRKPYLWLDKSLMRSIAALSEGASLSQKYETDFTFGLSGGEAKTIGLDLKRHKHYTYAIQIEC